MERGSQCRLTLWYIICPFIFNWVFILCSTVRCSRGSFAVGEQQWWTFWISSCVYGVPQETCAVVWCLWGRTRLPRSPPLSRSAKLPRSGGAVGLHGPFSAGGRISSGSFIPSCTKEECHSAWPGDRLCRWAVEDAMSRWPCMGQQLGKARATAEFWFSFSSSAGEFKNGKAGEAGGEELTHEPLNKNLQKVTFADQLSLPPGLWSVRI